MSRLKSDLEGVQSGFIPVVAGGSVSAVALVSGAAFVEGKAVTYEAQSANKEAVMGYGSAGDPLDGIIDKYESDGYMTVQNRGYRTAPGVSGSLPAAKDYVCVNGAGSVSKVAVQTAAGRGSAKAVSVDNTADVNTVMIFIG